MEFKLNKIDSDIRQRLEESTKTDKIHADKESGMIKQLKDDEEKGNNNRRNKKHNSPKRYITIDGIKYYGEEIQVKAERDSSFSEVNSRGIILDVKK